MSNYNKNIVFSPLVSIIIPCYNATPYITETLESVIAQTYTNWECIIVDDHSTDNSWEIIQSYQQRHPEKIFIHKNPRKGACAARNVGFKHSKGELIQYLDADDLIAGNKLQEQLQNYLVKGGSFVYSCKWGTLYRGKTNLHNSYPLYGNMTTFDYFKKLFENFGIFLPMHIFLCSRKLHEKAGKWNENLLQNQDADFFCNIISKSDGLFFSDTTYVLYRRDNLNSISRRNDKVTTNSLFYSYQLILSYLKNLEEKKSDYNEVIYLFLSNTYCKYVMKSKVISYWCLDYIKKSGYKKPKPIGGKKFNCLASVIGIRKTALLYKIKKKITDIIENH